ncbi:hypothetical protein A1D31_27185 [Bradyrhizobium liaoningense]|nr:hypothetical protein A1D31_27185 [Bradyrhizobium liaoningense]
MIDESRTGLHDRLGLVVRHGHHTDRGGSPKNRQRVADRTRGASRVIPGNHDVFEFRPKFVREMFGTEQKRPAGSEQEGFDNALCSAVVRFHGNQREVAEAGMLGQDRPDLIRGHLARSALGANVGAESCAGEGIQELLHVGSLGTGVLGIAIVRQHHPRSLEDFFLERERGDPGAEIGGNGHAFLYRDHSRSARRADKGQKDVLDGHPHSPGSHDRPARVEALDPRQRQTLSGHPGTGVDRHQGLVAWSFYE